MLRNRVIVKQDELHERLLLEDSKDFKFKSSGWKQTAKRVELRKCVLDNLNFHRIIFEHSADLTKSSLVNTTFVTCSFNDRCRYSLDGCDLLNCKFDGCRGGNDVDGWWTIDKLVDMIRQKKITFYDVKNFSQATFSDQDIKRAIKETYNL